jgi:hypothetical protein
LRDLLRRTLARNNVASLVNIKPETVRPLVTAIDPLVLPAFLELSSIAFFTAAFARKRKKVFRQDNSSPRDDSLGAGIGGNHMALG